MLKIACLRNLEWDRVDARLGLMRRRRRGYKQVTSVLWIWGGG